MTRDPRFTAAEMAEVIAWAMQCATGITFDKSPKPSHGTEWRNIRAVGDGGPLTANAEPSRSPGMSHD